MTPLDPGCRYCTYSCLLAALANKTDPPSRPCVRLIRLMIVTTKANRVVDSTRPPRLITGGMTFSVAFTRKNASDFLLFASVGLAPSTLSKAITLPQKFQGF